MKFSKYILIFMIFAMLLTGCEQKKKNQLEDISLRDLMLTDQHAYAQNEIVGLSFFIFELDSKKYSHVQAAIAEASQLPVTFSDEKSFADNDLICGTSGIEGWGKIAKSLADANASIVKRVTLFMDENTSEQIEAAAFPHGTTVNYKTGPQAAAAMGLPNGVVIFDINVKSLIGLKKVCRLEVNTDYKTLRKKVDNKTFPAWQYAFDSIDFNLPLRRGQFVFLGPRLDSFDTSDQNILPSLGHMIFTNSQNENRVKFCLIVCGLIKD
jgi:hypothetical protein